MPWLSVAELNIERGSSDGGYDYILQDDGSTLLPTSLNTDFETVDLAMWIDISTGGGYTEDYPHLYLSTGTTASSICGLEEDPFGLSLLEFKLNLFTHIVENTVRPMGYVYPIVYECEVSGIIARIKFQVDTLGDILCICEYYKSGVLSGYKEITVDYGDHELSILRYLTTVILFVDGEIGLTIEDFPTSASNVADLRFYSDNNGVEYDTTCLVEGLEEQTFVSFGGALDYDPVNVSARRLRGIVPPSLNATKDLGSYSGTVTVYTVNTGGAAALPSTFEYYYDKKLVSINSKNLKLSIVSDDFLKTLPSKNKGS
jgi:hypothetical protein